MTLSANRVNVLYRWPRRWVLRDLTFTVPRGSKTLLLGPNGAGKSTLLRVLAGAQKPSNGSIEIDGRPSRRGPQVAVSWMPQRIEAVPGLNVMEQIAYASWMHGNSRSTALSLADAAIDMVQLRKSSTRRSTTLSGGQLSRLGLAECLASGAGYLLLDEPTAALDPVQRTRFNEILAGLPPTLGIVVSSHLLDNTTAQIFERLAVLEEGKIRFNGPLAGFFDPTSSDLTSAYKAFVKAED